MLNILVGEVIMEGRCVYNLQQNCFLCWMRVDHYKGVLTKENRSDGNTALIDADAQQTDRLTSIRLRGSDMNSDK